VEGLAVPGGLPCGVVFVLGDDSLVVTMLQVTSGVAESALFPKHTGPLPWHVL
jgi:hypothetical protein